MVSRVADALLKLLKRDATCSSFLSTELLAPRDLEVGEGTLAGCEGKT